MSPRHWTLLRTAFAVFGVLLCACGSMLRAQARSTAAGPGSFVSVGGGASAFRSDYGQQTLGGGFVFADFHPTWRYGFELEARSLRLHSAEQVTEAMYLAGVRATWRPEGVSPYVKFLAGDGHISFPFGYATGDYLALVPGAGVEYTLNDRLTVRALDVEYGYWPQFSFGALKPWGFSTGLSIRVNALSRFPRGARARH